jgi:predicted nucleic acid-binding protein
VAVVIAYIDSSVLLRIVLDQPGPLEEWESLDVVVSSTLLEVEVRRTLDRFWLRHELSDDELARATADADALLRRVLYAELDPQVLQVAARPMPTILGTLDSLHLATALLYRDAQSEGEPSIVFATHDRQLSIAAQAMRFAVIGNP